MSATMLRHETPVAAKAHQCDCCLDQIPAGYTRQTGADHGIFTIKMHDTCYDLLMDYAAYHAWDLDEMPDWQEVLTWDREMKVSPGVRQ